MAAAVKAAAVKGVAALGIRTSGVMDAAALGIRTSGVMDAAAAMRSIRRGVLVGTDSGPRSLCSYGVIAAPRHFSSASVNGKTTGGKPSTDDGDVKLFPGDGKPFTDDGDVKPFPGDGKPFTDDGDVKPFPDDGKPFTDDGDVKPFTDDGKPFTDDGDVKPFPVDGKPFTDDGDVKPFPVDGKPFPGDSKPPSIPLPVFCKFCYHQYEGKPTEDTSTRQRDLDKLGLQLTTKIDKEILKAKIEYIKESEALKYEVNTKLDRLEHKNAIDLLGVRDDFSKLLSRHEKHKLEMDVAMSEFAARRIKMFGWFAGALSAIGAMLDVIKRSKGSSS